MRSEWAHLERRLRFVRLSLATAAVAGDFLMRCLGAETLASNRVEALDADLFRSGELPRIAIQISERGMQSLRWSVPRRNIEAKPTALAQVTENGLLYTNVTVQLKGFTSFQSVDRSPSLTLNFDKSAPGQRFRGLSKLSLNNSAQDPTRLNEKFSRELFAAAGVPVPRADYALVTLNGRDLGLYVLVEGFDRTFLKRHFKNADGNLFEGGILQDIEGPLKATTGKDPANKSAVQRLLQASREPDAEERWRALEASLDMDRFLSMVAMETILCHSDSYSMNRNNYRLYHDPGSDKIVFIPHGMDRVLGAHRSGMDLSILPPLLGLVARAVLSTGEGRRRHIERVGTLFTNFFLPDALCLRVREIDARISRVKGNVAAARPASSLTAGFGPRSRDAENLCGRISDRAAHLSAQFAKLEEVTAVVPCPDFDESGTARINGWKANSNVLEPRFSFEEADRGGKKVLHLRASERPMRVSIRAKIALPRGAYRLTGSIRTTDAGEAIQFVPAALLRYSSDRFGLVRQTFHGGPIAHSFRVLESRAPEEIEIVCSINVDSADLWFDASALRLIREKP